MKGKDLEGINKNVLLTFYCESGNRQVTTFLQVESNSLSGVGAVGVFRVKRELTEDEIVRGCECNATRPFLLRTDDLNDGPINVYILKKVDAKI